MGSDERAGPDTASGGSSRPAGRVVISGAGIAGLAAALRFRQAGWEPLVVERSPARRSGGYMLNLLGPGYAAAERMGVLPELTKRDFGKFTSIVVAADGRPKLTVPEVFAQLALGNRTVNLFRGDIETVLYEAVRDTAEIRFGTTVTAVSQDDAGVQVTLSDGATERAELLIGADGLHSNIRSLVFGPEERFRVDMHHVVAAYPLEAVPPDVPERAGTTFIGPGRTYGIVNLGPGRSSVFFTYRCASPDAELARGPRQALTAAYGDLGGAVPKILGQLRDSDQIYFDGVSQVVADSWSRGRVVLLGDAAWCVTLFAGYGASLAMAGADQLATALSARPSEDLAAVLKSWEDGLRPEVVKQQAIARRGMRRYTPTSTFQIRLNELSMRAVTLPGVRTLVANAVRKRVERQL